jgi:3-mercaptopyruvate sulfurtransferase SseA
VALKLRRFGIQRVRPLLGGIEAWRELRLPLVRREIDVSAAAPSSSAESVRRSQQQPAPAAGETESKRSRGDPH